MTLTLENIPLDLNDALRKKAEQMQVPVNQFAVEAMKAGLGLRAGSPKASATGNLAASIRAHFVPLGGVELAEPTREPMREPTEFAG